MSRPGDEVLSGRALFLDTETLHRAHHASLHDEDKEHGHAKDNPPSAHHGNTGEADEVAQLNANADKNLLHAAGTPDISVTEESLQAKLHMSKQAPGSG